VRHNIRIAESAALRWWRKGYAVICPHLNTAFFDGECDDDVWLKGDIAILERLRKGDVIVMLENWRESSGAVTEYGRAIELGVRVISD